MIKISCAFYFFITLQDEVYWWPESQISKSIANEVEILSDAVHFHVFLQFKYIYSRRLEIFGGLRVMLSDRQIKLLISL